MDTAAVVKAQMIVAEHFGVPRGQLHERSRRDEVTRPRDAAMFALRVVLRLKYQQIGQVFGRDHSSVMAGVRRAKHRRDTPTVIRKVRGALGQTGEFCIACGHPIVQVPR